MKKVLVIDDDHLVRDLFTQMLSRFGYEPVVASSGKTGLETLAANPDIAVVILDWMMPGMDGLDVMQQIKAMDSPPPVIMLSAKSRREDVMAAIKSGVNDFITKPAHIGQLILRINRLVEQQGSDVAEDEDASQPYLGLSARAALMLIDISSSGVCLETSFALNRGAVVMFSSEPTNHRLGLPEEYSFAVRVANCQAKGKRFHVGAEFIGLDPDVRERIRKACLSATGFRS